MGNMPPRCASLGEEFVADHVNYADVEVAHHPPRLNPVGGQAPVRAHVTDVEAKLGEKT